MLEGQKVLLRAVEPADAERVQRWINDVEGAYWSQAVPGAFSRRSQEMWLTRVGNNSDSSTRVFSVDTTDARHIGLIQLWGISWVHRRAQVNLLIGEPDYRGRGYEQDALRALTHFAFRNLNLNRLQATIPETITVRVQAFRDSGYVEEARMVQAFYWNGEYHDEILMRALIGEWRPTQIE